MNIIQSIVKGLAKNRPNSQGVDIDFSKMSVEDAIQMMFMLISQDAKRDMKDMLEDMDATRRKKSALREAANIRKNQGSGEVKDLGVKPAFANAVKDINADIDKLKKSEAIHRLSAEADRREAEANLAAAKDLESRAGGLEQPVETDNKKNRKRVPFILSAVIGLIVIGAAFVKYAIVVPPITPTVTPVSAPAGPDVGTLMLWVDGSTLVFYNGLWIYRSEVTNYQFSLCVEAGNCKPPTAGNPPSPDINDPEQANSPAQIIGPEAKLDYCSWAGGRVPTDGETTAFEGYQAPHPVRDFPLSTENNAPTAEPTAGSGHVEAQDDNFEQAPGFSVDIDSQTGKVTPTIDPLVGANDQTLGEIILGFRCVIEAPHPIAPACQTSAFYLNGPPAGMAYSVIQAGEFCQKGLGYVTLDIEMPEGSIIQSVYGDCELVGGNRLLCSAAPGVNSDGEVLILSDGAFVAARDFWRCPTGYQYDMDAGVCRIIPPPIASDSLRNCPPGQRYNAEQGVCLPEPQPLCPIGTYFDEDGRLCVAAGETTESSLAGYHFDDALQCNMSDLPSGLYPGCPPGQVYDPSISACDSENIYVAGGKVMHTVRFDFSTPFCEVKDNGSDDGESDSGSTGCNSFGDKLSCSNAGCLWNANLNACQ